MAFHFAEVLHLLLLALDIAFVLYRDFHLFGYICRKFGTGGIEGGQLLIVELRTAQQGNHGAAVCHIRSALFRKECGEGGRGGGAHVGQTLDLLLYGCILFFHSLQALFGNEADLIAPLRQTLVGVVLTQQKAVFAAGSHNTVGLIGTLGHQVINQSSDVALTAGENKITFTPQLTGGVDASNKTLHGSLLITGGTVELAGTVKAGDLLGLQCGVKGKRIDAVVFDGVGRTGHHSPAQAGDAVEHPNLDLFRHGGRKTLNVQFLGIKTHGFHEQLMPLLIREANNFRFKRGTVTGTDAFDQTGIHGSQMEVVLNDLLGFIRGPGEPTDSLILGRFFGGIGEWNRLLITGLHLHLIVIHTAGIDAGRRTGFEAAQRQAQLQQGIRQPQRGVHAVRTGVLHTLADDGAAGKEGAGGNDGSFYGEHRAGGQNHSGDRTVFRADFHYFALTDGQMLLLFQRVLHDFLIFAAVCLSTQAPDSRTFAAVQQAVLDTAFVGSLCHFAAQGIQFPN